MSATFIHIKKNEKLQLKFKESQVYVKKGKLPEIKLVA